MKKWNLSVSDLGSWGVDALRGPLLHSKCAPQIDQSQVECRIKRTKISLIGPLA
jgi:hypothetical protein